MFAAKRTNGIHKKNLYHSPRIGAEFPVMTAEVWGCKQGKETQALQSNSSYLKE
jgi:hypothetical protein